MADSQWWGKAGARHVLFVVERYGDKPDPDADVKKKTGDEGAGAAKEPQCSVRVPFGWSASVAGPPGLG